MKTFSILFTLFFSVLLGAETVTGVVSSVDSDKGTLALADSSGRTTEYFAGPGDLQPGFVGKTVRGEKMTSGKSVRLERIWPADAVEIRLVDDTAGVLQRAVAQQRGSVFLRKGETIPDFALWNQHGRLVRPADLRGKHIVLNCIFTRCKNAEMCPRQTAQMVALQRELAARGIGDVMLLSFTFDPDYDTPGILKAYADAYRVDGEDFFFLTGPKQQTDALMRLFGIVTVAEDGTINHNVATLLVGTDGKILHRRDGPRWKPEEFISRIRH